MMEPSDVGLESLSLCPVNYFLLEADCHYLPSRENVSQKKYRLPDVSELNCEESFADVHMGWNEEGLAFLVKVHQLPEGSAYPNPEEGDSVELYIDTRDIKTARFNHRFCHHFAFLAEQVEGVQAAELTHFRTEDVHPLCDPRDLEVQVTVKKSSYVMSIWVPAKSLHGYDTSQCDRLGFSYRINRWGGEPQHFSVHSAEYHVDQNPSLWSRLRWVR